MMDSNKAYCPNPKCKQVTKCDKKKTGKAICESCQFEFCGKCQIPWSKHEKMTCEQALEEEMGEFFTNSDLSNCPKCGVRVEKISGCNHIKCPQCEHGFCWICGAGAGYGHFLPFNPFGCPGMICK